MYYKGDRRSVIKMYCLAFIDFDINNEDDFEN